MIALLLRKTQNIIFNSMKEAALVYSNTEKRKQNYKI